MVIGLSGVHIRSVIIRVINIITSRDRIGRHEILLPINHNYNKIRDILGFFKTKNKRNSVSFLFVLALKKPSKSSRDGAYCLITLSDS